MRRKHVLLSVAASAACIAAVTGAFLTGCTTEPPSDFFVTVSPSTVSLYPNETQMFIATGASRYEWSLSQTTNSVNDTNTIWGVLDRATGDRVIYRNLRTPPTNENRIQVLHVVGFLGTGDTNSTEVIQSSTDAFITHVRVGD